MRTTKMPKICYNVPYTFWQLLSPEIRFCKFKMFALFVDQINVKAVKSFTSYKA